MLQIARLTRELLDVRCLARDKRQRHDTRYVHLGAVDVHVEAELLADVLDVLETLLVVGTSTTDPDLDLVLIERRSDFPQGADDTLEGRGNVGEVGNTTTNEQNLALRVLRSTEHEVKNCSCVVEGLCLCGSTRVFTVVGELTGESSRCDGISVDDGSTTTGNESPDTASSVQDGKLEGCTSLSIHLGDVSLLLAHLTTERSREFHWGTDVNGGLSLLGRSNWDAESSCAASDSPLSTALELSSLVELSSKIEEVNLGRGLVLVGDNDERVDLEVTAGLVSDDNTLWMVNNLRELAVNVDGVQPRDEVNEDIVDTLRNLLQESGGDLLVRGELLEVDRNEKLLSLLVNITNINTTLVGEEDPITLKRDRQQKTAT